MHESINQQQQQQQLTKVYTDIMELKTRHARVNKSTTTTTTTDQSVHRHHGTKDTTCTSQ